MSARITEAKLRKLAAKIFRVKITRQARSKAGFEVVFRDGTGKEMIPYVVPTRGGAMRQLSNTLKYRPRIVAEIRPRKERAK